MANLALPHIAILTAIAIVAMLVIEHVPFRRTGAVPVSAPEILLGNAVFGKGVDGRIEPGRQKFIDAGFTKREINAINLKGQEITNLDDGLLFADKIERETIPLKRRERFADNIRADRPNLRVARRGHISIPSFF